MFKKTQIKKFEKGLIQYGLKHNYIEKTKEGLKFVGSKNQIITEKDGDISDVIEREKKHGIY